MTQPLLQSPPGEARVLSACFNPTHRLSSAKRGFSIPARRGDTPGGRRQRGTALRRMSRLSIALLGVAACGEASDPPPPFAVRDSSGIVIAENAEPLWGAGEGWTIEPEPNLTIGVITGPREFTLDRVDHVLQKPDGEIVVANRGSHELRMYDGAGVHLRSIGRYGDGPGEFRSIRGVTVHGDSLVVFDSDQRRITVLDHVGGVRGTVPLEPTGDPVAILDLYRLAGMSDSGQLIMHADGWMGLAASTPGIREQVAETLRYDLAGRRLGTFAEPLVSTYFASPQTNYGTMFSRFGSLALKGGDVFFADRRTYQVRQYREGTTLDRIVRVLVEPRPVTEQDLHEWYTLGSGYAGKAHSDLKPWLSQVIVDDTGHLWTLEYDPYWRPIRTWSVFTPEGRWLGRVRAPDNLRVTEIRSDQVIGVFRDENEVEFVVRHRLIRS